jgi:agmatinase
MMPFANFPSVDPRRIAGAKGVILGVAEASPYKPGTPSHSADAPAALRTASQSFAGQLGHFDFDLNATLCPDGSCTGSIADGGNVETDCHQGEENRRRITQAVRGILEAGAVPIVLGGDDSVPIPVFAAFEGGGPYTILQIDAHADWGDVIQDNPFGYGSPMRRASEMPWIAAMVQVGLRGLGSGGEWQIRDARKWGAQLISSRQYHDQGVSKSLASIRQGDRVIVTIDCDGIDPAVLPAVNMPTPGGLSYEDMLDILHGVAERGRIAGVIVTELVPQRDDPFKLSALTAARLVSVAAGLVAQQACEAGEGPRAEA